MFRRTKLPALASGQIDNVLGPNTSVTGTVKSDGNIRVEGVFQGRIETAGNVIIGTSARVLADIVAHTVQIWGAVRGDIVATGRLEILPSGRVWGDVDVASMLVDEGGMFRGRCTMGGEQVEPLTLPGHEPTAGLVLEDVPAPEARQSTARGREQESSGS